MPALSLLALRLKAILSKLPNNRSAPLGASVWLLDGRRVRQGDLLFLADRLSAGERQRYGGFVRRERSRQFLLGRVLVKLAVAHLMGCPPDQINFSELSPQLPRIVFPDAGCSRPNVSLSHSRDWVACVVSREATLGIDIEVNDPTRNFAALSHAAFHPRDHLWLLSRSEEDRRRIFYELWCTMEALIKLETHRGSEPSFPAVVGIDGQLLSETASWHRYSVPHSDLTIVVCSDRRISSLIKIELNELTPAHWLTEYPIVLSQFSNGR
jgi:4'-phosphopantetheinyl transferase